MKMSSEVEAFRQMSDREVEEIICEMKCLRSNNEIMKKMLATIETINDLLKNKSLRCKCKESIDTKVNTKLNVLNKKYIELKDKLELKSDHNLKNNLIIIKIDGQKTDDSFTEQCIDPSIETIDQNVLSDDQFIDENIVESNNQNFDDLKNNCQESDESLAKGDNEEVRTVFDSEMESEVEDYEYCCEFSDTKTGILCQKKFTTRQTLINHVIGHSGHKPWFCEYPDCKYRAVLRGHLIGHIRKSHTARHQFQCDWPGCDFRGPSRYNVKRHKTIHTNEKPYKCDWPGCEFRSPNNKIAEHKRIHTGEKPYLCSWVGCEARFSRPFTLKSHLRTHTGEKPFKCDYPDCHYSSSQQTPLTTHKRKHHNWAKESSEEVVFSDNIIATDL